MKTLVQKILLIFLFLTISQANSKVQDIRSINRDIAQRNFTDCEKKPRSTYLGQSANIEEMNRKLEDLPQEKKDAAKQEVERHKKQMEEIIGKELVDFFGDEPFIERCK